MRYKIKIMILIVVMLFSTTFLFRPLEANRILNLMIVAHPDDESIWGGIHLSKGDYYVICLTSQNNKKRSDEFYKVLKKTNNEGIILNYPDKINGKRSDWKYEKKQIKKQLNKMIKSNAYKTIVSHNPKGEYGHKQHIMTSKIVSEICIENKIEDKLYYFGNYVKKSEMNDSNKKMDLRNRISKEELNRKKDIVSIYKSQGKVMNKLNHMFAYENWIAYKDWNK